MVEPRASHHHRSSLKQVNKAFKGTTALKRAELHGRLFKKAASRSGRRSAPASLSKADRLNKLAMQMEAKREAHLQDCRLYSGPHGLPRLLSIVPLSVSADGKAFSDFLTGTTSPTTGVLYCEKQKRKFQVLPQVVTGDLMSFIDQVSQADTIVFLVNTLDESLLDETALSAIRTVGCSSSVVVFLEDEGVALRKRRAREEVWRQVLDIELPSAKHFFSFNIHNMDCKRDLFFFTLSNVGMRGISWRDQRPYLLIDECREVEGGGEGVVLCGHVRGQPLNANLTVCIPGVGLFPMKQVRLLAAARSSGMQCDEVVAVADGDASDQALVDGVATDASASESETEADVVMGLVDEKPAAAASYQDAWNTEGEGGDIGSDDEEGGDIGSDDEDSQSELDAMNDSSSHKGVEAIGKSVSFKDVDMDDEAALNELRQNYEKQFPDELELDCNESARHRLIKYRAVKSLRTSEWDDHEGLPLDYAQIFAFQNYKASRKRALRLPESPFGVGCRVEVQLVVPGHKLGDLTGKTAFFLLTHENKHTVLNFTVKRSKDALEATICSKERLLMVAGPHRLWVNPVFSEHSNGNLHKLLRVLPEDGIHVGTVFGPVIYDPCSVMLFRQQPSGDMQLMLSGSILSNDPNRKVLKRVTLTGSLFKIHRKIVVARFMFFNSADVNYFKPVELMTKQHRRGHIKESLGTHGYMKCLFDKQVQQHDTIFMHLYKRTFPKWTTEQYYY